MDMLSMDVLRALAEQGNGWCVSIFMPTHRAGDEIQQDAIRLENLLDRAEETLLGGGLRAPQARELLEPARELVQDELFWQRQSDGLALFLSSDLARAYRLPADFEELAIAARRFHIKPLLSLFSGHGRFYLLALSQGEIQLLQGTRYSVREVDGEELPRGLAEALRYDDPERRLQFHTATRTPGGRGERPALFHGHGTASEDDPKDYVRRYFRQVDEGMSELLRGGEVPLVLAGVDYLLPLYREVNTYPHLVEESIEGNPEPWSAEELHQRAWAIVEPLFQGAQREAADHYLQLAGRGSDLASCDIREIVPAAYDERVSTLFVALEIQRWGVFVPDTRAVELHEGAEPGDEDLLDFAAVHTLLNGGTVHAVEPEEVPDDALLAALFRYPL